MEWISLPEYLNAQWCFQNAFQFNFWSQQLTLCHSKRKWNGMKELAIITPVTPSAMRNDGAGWLCLELWPCEELWGRDSGSGSESRGEINSWRDDSEAVRAKGCSFRQLDCRQCSDNTIKRSFRLRVQRVKRGESQIVPESDGGNASVSASTKQIKAGYILATNMKLVL